MRASMLLLGCWLGLLAVSCAASPTPEVARPGVTNLQAPDRAVHLAPVTDPRTTDAAEALTARDYDRVLALTATPSVLPAGAWLDYDRGSALTALARTDEAVEAFRRAEVRFGEVGDDAGRAVSIWGRARALDEAHRCGEARAAFEDYQAFVRLREPRAAEMAAAYSGACMAPVVLH